MTKTFKNRVHSLRDKLLFSQSKTAHTNELNNSLKDKTIVQPIARSDQEVKFDLNGVLLVEKPGVKWEDIVGLGDVKRSYV